MIDALVAVWDVIVTKISSNALCNGLVIVSLSRRWRVDFDVSVLREACILVAVAALVSFQVNLPSGVMTDMFACAIMDITCDMSADADANMQADIRSRFDTCAGIIGIDITFGSGDM